MDQEKFDARQEIGKLFSDDADPMEQRLFLLFLHTFWQRNELERPTSEHEEFFDTMTSLMATEPGFKDRLINIFNFIAEDLKTKTQEERIAFDQTLRDFDSEFQENRRRANSAGATMGFSDLISAMLNPIPQVF